MTDTVSNEYRIEIGSVFPPFEMTGGEILDDVCPGAVEERAHRSFGGDGTDSAQTRRPAPAKEAVQHGFGLIRTGMASRHPVHRAGQTKARVELPPSFPSGLLEISSLCGDVRRLDRAGELKAVRGSPDEFRIGIRFSPAQFMIQVQHVKGDAQLRGEFVQYVEKTDGIRSAGDGHACTNASRKHPVHRDSSFHPVEHVLFYSLQST